VGDVTTNLTHTVHVSQKTLGLDYFLLKSTNSEKATLLFVRNVKKPIPVSREKECLLEMCLGLFLAPAKNLSGEHLLFITSS
jgi:hypothetical protein